MAMIMARANMALKSTATRNHSSDEHKETNTTTYAKHAERQRSS